jgi:hypothetical protein
LLGYTVLGPPEKCVNEIASYTNIVFDISWMTGSGEGLIEASRKAGLKVVMLVNNRDAFKKLGMEMARRNRDVVFAVSWIFPDTVSDVATFGKDLKQELSGIEYWVQGYPDSDFPVPEEVDVVALDFSGVTPDQVSQNGDRTVSRWKEKANGRPLLLNWTCWSEKPTGSVPACQPGTMRACADLVKKHELCGVCFYNYGIGAEESDTNHVPVGLQIRPDLVAEIKGFSDKWGVAQRRAVPTPNQPSAALTPQPKSLTEGLPDEPKTATK